MLTTQPKRDVHPQNHLKTESDFVKIKHHQANEMNREFIYEKEKEESTQEDLSKLESDNQRLQQNNLALKHEN